MLTDILTQSFINSDVSLEEPYQLEKKRKDIDIQLSFLAGNHTETHRIIIENKIKIGAANPTQLNEYYDAIVQDDSSIKNLIVVFLTPESSAIQLTAEFDNLKILDTHGKDWMYWDSESNCSCITSMIREVLRKEALGEINPINEYMRHTLKAFIKHITAVVAPPGNRARRVGEDLGEIIAEASIELHDGKSYRVVRRDSSQIQVYNSDTGDKVVARHILQKFIDENNLQIPYNSLNTRGIGQQFFNWYSTQST